MTLVGLPVKTAADKASPSDRAVTSFFEGVRKLTVSPREVSRISRAVLCDEKGKVTTHLRELHQLERTIAELKKRLEQEASLEAPAPSASTRTVLRESPDASESVRSKLEEMIGRKELLPASRFLENLGLSKQALSKAVATNRMFYVDYKGGRYFPAFYVDPMYRRSHLEEITKQLGCLSGGGKLQFFINRRGSLAGATPLEALTQGKLQKVKDVAAAFAEQR